VDANDLSISVTQGEIKLNNVEVKSSAFDDLELPITIKSGTVGQIGGVPQHCTQQKNELLQGSSATPGDTSDAGMVKKMLNNMIF
jgi:hypothetical protein